MQNGVDYVEEFLKPTISEHIDILTSRAQMIAMDKEINNKLEELRKAGEDLKLSVNTKVDQLIKQANIKKPDTQDTNYDDQVKIYIQWLDQATQGVKRVHHFFDRIWIKIKQLLDKIFLWIRQSLNNLIDKIYQAFRIVKITLLR